MLTGTDLRARLQREHVLVPFGYASQQQQQQQQLQCGLNIVRTWDPYATSVIVLIPVIFSLATSITWSVVAIVHYKADIQTSFQTGFTIGSYVVTAGMLQSQNQIVIIDNAFG
jgi:hypothetical protein